MKRFSTLFILVLSSMTITGCGDSVSTGDDVTVSSFTASISCNTSTSCGDDSITGKPVIVSITDTSGTIEYIKNWATVTCTAGTCTASVSLTGANLLPSSTSPGTSYLVKAWIASSGVMTQTSGDPVYDGTAATDGLAINYITGATPTISLTGATWADIP